MVKVFAASVLALSLAACGGGGGDDSKPLFSLWTSEQTGARVDLTGGTLGSENKVNLYTQDGTRCICDLALIGTEDSGSLAITGCISIPYNAARDPQCIALQGSGTYSKTTDVLSITRNGATGTFR